MSDPQPNQADGTSPNSSPEEDVVAAMEAFSVDYKKFKSTTRESLRELKENVEKLAKTFDRIEKGLLTEPRAAELKREIKALSQKVDRQLGSASGASSDS